MKKKYKINEIFYSIQGEGEYAGKAAIFIRFSGCNMKCSFCDTNHSPELILTKQEIIEITTQYQQCDTIILTGGEPLLQLDKELLSYLKSMGYNLHLETNGTINNDEVLDFIDFITVSPKSHINWKLKKGNELKVVYSKKSKKNLDLCFKESNFDYYYLQPCFDESEKITKENIKTCVDYILKNPHWKLSLQTQKMINIR